MKSITEANGFTHSDKNTVSSLTYFSLDGHLLAQT